MILASSLDTPTHSCHEGERRLWFLGLREVAAGTMVGHPPSSRAPRVQIYVKLHTTSLIVRAGRIKKYSIFDLIMYITFDCAEIAAF